MTEKTVGLYVHFPFCAVKCPYCDFYSQKLNAALMDKYVSAAAAEIKKQKEKYACRFDTVYFGGGTPSVMGEKRLITVANAVGDMKNITEFTVECNTAMSPAFFQELAQAGVNRVSVGLQSANTNERKTLGRRASVQRVAEVVAMAKRAGIDNVSLDLMLAVPGQTKESLKRSVAFCAENGAKHISAYLLKIEENTPFYFMRESLDLPDEDESAELYLLACELLEGAGYRQYEISNFAVPGFESRHNLKYWHCMEYLGIGPAAYSFMDGERFSYVRDTEKFITNPETVFDSSGGDFEEYAMLALRLNEGLRKDETLGRFGHAIPEKLLKNAAKLQKRGLLIADENGVRLTCAGFLLSNSVIGELLYG